MVAWLGTYFRDLCLWAPLYVVRSLCLRSVWTKDCPAQLLCGYFQSFLAGLSREHKALQGHHCGPSLCWLTLDMMIEFNEGTLLNVNKCDWDTMSRTFCLYKGSWSPCSSLSSLFKGIWYEFLEQLWWQCYVQPNKMRICEANHCLWFAVFTKAVCSLKPSSI